MSRRAPTTTKMTLGLILFKKLANVALVCKRQANSTQCQSLSKLSSVLWVAILRRNKKPKNPVWKLVARWGWNTRLSSWASLFCWFLYFLACRLWSVLFLEKRSGRCVIAQLDGRKPEDLLHQFFKEEEKLIRQAENGFSVGLADNLLCFFSLHIYSIANCYL